MQPIPAARAAIVAHTSRWGHHPCDRETFLLLKRLYCHWRKALHGYHVSQRWQRKEPQNRVVRQVIRNHRGQRVGTVVVGPRAEPLLCPVFTRRESGRVICEDFGIESAYRNARRPKPTPEEVQPLALTTERIRELLIRLE